jgi:hypothetical protein
MRVLKDLGLQIARQKPEHLPRLGSWRPDLHWVSGGETHTRGPEFQSPEWIALGHGVRSR